MSTFLICYLFIAIALSLAINYLLLKFSFNLGSRNNLAFKQVRWTAHVKPSIGGISFFIIFLLSWGIYGFISQERGIVPDKQIIGIVAATSLGFMAGLYDDAFNTNPLLKFILQLSCGVILISFNVKITISNIEFINIFFTLIWVIGLMNSINMLDNMDGVTASISAFIIAGLIGILAMTDHAASEFYMLILIGVLGALIGFLRFNWSPSRIFMGDTGSQFLGVFLASTSILFFWQFNEGNQGLLQVKPFVLPALFFIIPIIDTTTVTVRRLLRGQSPFVGGKDHITHHLAYLGLKESTIVLVLLGTTLISFPLAIILVKNPLYWNFYVSFGMLAYVVALFFVFQYFYKKGELAQAKKRQDQRPIPKITKESLAAFNEKMQVNN
ncbi:MAG TPA: MraY family glycosyltransferase [Chitinophagaceae bacterium]|nr:MraY family glycosyltransferase [Chitinophagaceae bacterium]